MEDSMEVCTGAGKGDTYRDTNKRKSDEEYDRIFGEKRIEDFQKCKVTKKKVVILTENLEEVLVDLSNFCINCELWEPHQDDMSPEEIKKLNLERIKENCSKCLCNNGTCPHYAPTWRENENNH